MNYREEILDGLVLELTSLNLFKDVFKGIIPAWSHIRNTPSVAVAIKREHRTRTQTTGCMFNSELEVIIMIYNETGRRTYEDILSEYIIEIEKVINTSDILNALVTDIYVEEIINDTGLIHPKAIAELTVKCFYRQQIN